MIGARRATLASALFVAATPACVDVHALELSSLPEVDGARSVLLALEASSGVLAVEAVDLERGAPARLALSEGVTLTAFVYPHTLDALGFTPGPLAVDRTSARPMPRDPSLFVATETSDGWQWRAEAQPSRALTELRITDELFPRCELRGGCVRTELGREWCELPCFVPEAPAEPEAPALPVTPAPANLPILIPCPVGWAPITADGLDVCAPPRIFGTTCPVGQYAEARPSAGASWFVDPAVPEGGDGSEARPFTSAARALEAARDGDTILLSKGVHAGLVTVTSSVTLTGACAEGREATTIAAISVDAPSAAVMNLRVRPGAGLDGTSMARPNTRLRLERVVFDGGEVAIEPGVGGQVILRDAAILRSATGLRAVYPGASITATRVYVASARDEAVLARDGGSVTLIDALLEGSARGVTAEGSGGVELARVRIAGATSGGARSELGARLVVTDVVVDDAEHVGISVRASSSLVLTRARVARATGFGVEVSEGVATIEDLTVVDTRTRNGGDNGEGLVVYGAEVTARRVLLDDNVANGLVVMSSPMPAVLRASDLRVRATKPRALFDVEGGGIEVRPGTRVHLERASFDDNAGPGVALYGELEAAGVNELADVTVRGGARGLVTSSRTHVRAARLHALDVAGEGLALSGAATIEDLFVERSGAAGVGVDAGIITVSRARIVDATVAGLSVQHLPGLLAPSLALTDVSVVGTRGFGVWAAAGRTTAERLVIEDARGLGVCVHGAALDARDVVVADTLRPSAPLFACGSHAPETTGVSGVHVEGRVDRTAAIADLSLERFVLRGCRDTALEIDRVANVGARAGLIEDNGLGLSLEQNDLTSQHLDDDVVYRGNDVNVRIQ
ncbi:right-handed parallel beta-helix repeat-containing protein [Myxococcota bacterium]|nr:right-handed parallel beta-helix repeat-containing protein [Myxococcota bacterium]